MTIASEVLKIVHEARNIQTFSKTKLFIKVSLYHPSELVESIRMCSFSLVKNVCYRIAIDEGWFDLLSTKHLKRLAIGKKIKAHNLVKSQIIVKLRDHERKIKQESRHLAQDLLHGGSGDRVEET